MAALFYAEDLDRAAQAFVEAAKGVTTQWDEFRGQHLSLPDWYNHDLDPLSHAYLQQQDRLWQLISGRQETYESSTNEQAPEVGQMDPLIRPGLYLLDTETAGHHLIALGHLVKLSGITVGERVLEYGAGFGQIAVTFARLGAIVDTVDINEDFCNAVTAQAKWLDLPLTAHKGSFGHNPVPGIKYKLIIFYESFHHAREFLKLIDRLHDLLREDGKILLAGEPIGQSSALEIPYAWGMRLDMECSAIVRLRGWYEIGFQEEFLLRCFVHAGFMVRKHTGMLSHYATTYEFRKRPAVVKLAEWPLMPVDEATWHQRESAGRWTTGISTFCLDQKSGWTSISLVTQNLHRRNLAVCLICGGQRLQISLEAGERQTVQISRCTNSRSLQIVPQTIVPRTYGIDDDRRLGLFVEQIEYC